MIVQLDWPEERKRRLRDWLLLLLRFSITREPKDRSAVMACATELDCLPRPRGSFSFFERTSNNVCEAIVAARDEGTTTILSQFAMRIDESRLRAAFCACTGLPERPVEQPERPRAAKRDVQNLWKGLSKR